MVNEAQPANRVRRIVGGDLSKKGTWPWLVSIHQHEDSVYYHYEEEEDVQDEIKVGDASCVGSIISSKYIVTSAECIRKSDSNTRFVVGEYITNIPEDNIWERTHEAEKSTIHEKYYPIGGTTQMILH